MLREGKILVPVDLESGSEAVLKAAGDVAGMTGSGLVVMHVVQPVPPLPMAAQVPPGSTGGFNVELYQQTLEERARENVDELIRRSLPSSRGVPVVLATGRIGHTIVEECSSGDYDLVVLGSGGEGDLLARIVGSVADYVVRNAPASVLVVRNREADAGEGEE